MPCHTHSYATPQCSDAAFAVKAGQTLCSVINLVHSSIKFFWKGRNVEDSTLLALRGSVKQIGILSIRQDSRIWT